MDIRKVKKLIELLEESGIAEIEIKEGEESVRISRNGNMIAAPVAAAAPMVAAPLAPQPVAAIEPAAPSNDNAIVSPMVGTFYLSSTPGAAPFVSVGQQIKKGDIIGIIEAMKIMNQIESDRDGVVQAIAAEDGKPVEFGQPLLVIG